MKIGLALGGGGAKGFYHIGVIKGLEKIGIKIDSVSGTSMGAIIGGLYALHLSADEVKDRIIKVLQNNDKFVQSLKNFSDPFDTATAEKDKRIWDRSLEFMKDFCIWNLRIIRPYLADTKPFLKIFHELFENHCFADCKIPFYATGVDLLKGKEVILSEGSIFKAVMASSAFPGVFPPLQWDKHLLVDGGVLVPLPSKVLRQKRNFVIGVNLDTLQYSYAPVNKAVDVMFLVDKIRFRRIIDEGILAANFCITGNLDGMSWADFSSMDAFINKGIKDVMDNKDKLLKTLKIAKIKSIFFFS